MSELDACSSIRERVLVVLDLRKNGTELELELALLLNLPHPLGGRKVPVKFPERNERDAFLQHDHALF